MQAPHGITRVILVVLDGLRPDAIATLPLPTLGAVAAGGAHTLAASTVEPSLTAAALTSLFTGVTPAVHGIRSEHALIPRPGQRLTLLPRLLHDHGYRMFGFMAALPHGFRTLGTRIAARLGAAAAFAGQDADSILDEALPTLERVQRGVVFLHWPDADAAGHAHGWMSREYLTAARRLDGAFERLIDATAVLTDPGTVLVAMADHGGGGTCEKDHHSNHPLDLTIPIVIAGGQVTRILLPASASLLDVTSTVPWVLGIDPPNQWMGRPLREAFVPVADPAAVPSMEEAAA
jgi:predicted AlkP superfamily pyrophosphatase or phosphodiesterase